MPDKSKLEKQVDRLSRRLEEIERRLDDKSPVTGKSDSAKGPGHGPDHSVALHKLGHCQLPPVAERSFGRNVSRYRERLITYINKKWVNGTKLKYYFFDSGVDRGDPDNVELVRRAFDVWRDVGIGIEFEEATDIDEAMIRIGFRRGDGAWSYVGRDVRDIPGARERTMNFGWDLTQDPRGDGLDTPIHEIGHTLGFPHEHQNPFAGIQWDEEAVYQYFAGPPNFWPRSQTYHNVIRKLESREVAGSDWDPDSIMHYSFPADLILEPAEYRNGLRPRDGLTDIDRREALKFYPPLQEERFRKLKSFQLEHLDLAPAEQANFTIRPERSDVFQIETFGHSDVVMVLFEDLGNGQHEFVAGDDDSGSDLNAKLRVRLIKDRKYILRIRMYLNFASGQSAVLMW